MAIWYEVEKTERGLAQFMECNWEFHDFCIRRVAFFPERDEIEMFLEYDDPREGVFLRFLGVRDFGIVPGNWYEDAYLWGATLAFAGDGGLVWLSDELFREETIEELKDRTCWVRADRIIWAISNADGEPGEMPSGKLHQICSIYGQTVEKHYSFPKCDGTR